MILHAPKSNQTVEIVIPDNVKKIAVSVSGGADSTILLYILCKHIKENNLDITILPTTAVVLAKPIMVEGAFRVVNKIRELFNHDIDFLLDNHMFYTGLKSTEYNIRHDVTLLDEGVVDMIISGTTTFPPEDISKKLGMWENRPQYRAVDLNVSVHDQIDENHTVYKPFTFVDKRFVAEMYEQFGVMDTLYPITRSCIKSFSQTRGWSKPCGKCHWCVERKWAFGSLDTERRTYIESLSHKVYSWDPVLPKDNMDQEILERKKRLAGK